MKTVTVCSMKGGVGKSTAAVMMSYALASSGVKVAICDLDSNASATSWINAWPMDGLILQEKPSSPLPEGVAVRFLDYEGASRNRFPALIRSTPPTDLYLIPSSPDGMDMEIVAATLGVIRELRPDSTIALLWNRIVKRAADSDPAVLASYAEQLKVKALKATVRQYKDTARARLDHGWRNVRTEIRNEWKAVATELLVTLLER